MPRCRRTMRFVHVTNNVLLLFSGVMYIHSLRLDIVLSFVYSNCCSLCSFEFPCYINVSNKILNSCGYHLYFTNN